MKKNEKKMHKLQEELLKRQGAMHYDKPNEKVSKVEAKPKPKPTVANKKVVNKPKPKRAPLPKPHKETKPTMPVQQVNPNDYLDDEELTTGDIIFRILMIITLLSLASIGVLGAINAFAIESTLAIIGLTVGAVAISIYAIRKIWG